MVTGLAFNFIVKAVFLSGNEETQLCSSQGSSKSHITDNDIEESDQVEAGQKFYYMM